MLRLALVMASLAFVCSQPAGVAAGWSRSSEDHGRRLSYAGDVTVLGQATHLDATFYCNTERTKMVTGAIGFDLDLAHPEAIKTFDFDDFEGPDAPAGKRQLLMATIVRPNGAQEHITASPSGSYSPRESFAFEVSDFFYRKGTPARRVLEALRSDATSLTITIADYQRSTTRIELTIPVAGTSGEFRWLLEGLQ